MPEPLLETAVSEIRYSLLSAAERPLLNKFYRAQGTAMRASAKGEAWVARAGELVAAVNMSAVPEGFWLTGLLVAPAWRGRRIARQLIEHACAGKPGTVWLFCHPDLLAFYQPLGFSPAGALPLQLNERLARYQRSKSLIALARDQSSLAGSSPGNSTSV